MTLGTRPSQGFTLIDGLWARGLSDGNNDTFQNSVTAHAGGTQAAAFVLPVGNSFIEVDTCVTNNDSVALPFAVAGERKMLFNNTGQTLAVFANPATNPATATLDVINRASASSAYNLTTGQAAIFFCSKNGTWAAIKTA